MKIVFTVTNELNYDQRMQRICNSLSSAGFEVLLVGWNLKKAPPLVNHSFAQKRLPLFFQKGKMRYIETNVKLFFYLLFVSCDVFCAIDLDTILPNYLIAKIRNKKIVYDAHEYFTELEEVVRRPMIKKIWTWIESVTVPNIKNGYTISNSYAKLFQEKYGVKYEIVSNIAPLKDFQINSKKEKIILYQGAVGEGRALFQLTDAMQFIDAKLLICGNGNVFEQLQQHINQLDWKNKIKLKGFVAPQNLAAITPTAMIGITLFETKGLSNYYSLANRFFDYLHAGIPQICNAYPEYVAINQQDEIAELVEQPTTELIAAAINKLLNDNLFYKHLQENCQQARLKYNWQNEEKKLIAFYKKIEQAIA